MIEKSLDELVENTCTQIEDFLETHISPKWMDIHEDVVILYLFLDKSQKPDYNPGEHELTGIMEAMARCRTILEYGDKLILLSAIKPLYHGNIFGVN